MSTIPIDYTNRDYISINTALQQAIPTYMPEWTSTSESDFGITLIELFAYQADIINYYLDRIANESFLGTCQQLASALQIAALIGYTPTGVVPSSAVMSLMLSVGGSYPYTLPQGTQFSTQASSSSAPIVFETPQAYVFSPGQAGLTVNADSTGAPLTVIQGQTVSNEVGGSSNGAPNQNFNLFNLSVITGSVNVYVDQGTGPKVWRQVNNLVTAGPTDLVYSLSTDSNGITWVAFGDGHNGAIPTAAAAISTTYRIGGGAVGNVGAGSIIVGTTGNIVALTNILSASGGQDAETIAEIQINAPQSITAAGRCVSLQDYEALVLEVPSVAKASATAQVPTNISLYIHPSTSVLPLISLTTQVAALASSVQSYLANSAVPPGATITILPPQYAGSAGYVPVVIVAAVTAATQYQATQVQQDVVAAIRDLFDFTTIQFGQYIPLSSVYQTILGVEGVSFATITCMCRYEVATNTGGVFSGPVGDITCAANEIPVVIDPITPYSTYTLMQIAVTGGS